MSQDWHNHRDAILVVLGADLALGRPQLEESTSTAYLDELEAKISPKLFVRFEQALRPSPWQVGEQCSTWFKISPRHIHDSLPVATLCFLSAHPNGHVREAAVRAMKPDPRLARWLFVRTNDWVQPVAGLAQAKALGQLRVDWARSWLSYLTLIYNSDNRRRSYRRLLDAVYEFGQRHETVLQDFVRDRTAPVRSRRLALALLLQNHPEAGRRAGESSDDVSMRSLCLMQEQDAQRLRAFRQDPVPNLRWRALFRLAELGLINQEDLKNGLLDRAASVRDYSKYLCKKVADEEFLCSTYQQAPTSVGKLLGAVGVLPNQTLQPLLLDNLQSPRPSLVKAALTALSRVEASPDDLLWQRLEDPNPMVRRLAGRLLRDRKSHYLSSDLLWKRREQVSAEIASELLQLASRSPCPYTRIRAALQRTAGQETPDPNLKRTLQDLRQALPPYAVPANWQDIFATLITQLKPEAAQIARKELSR